MIKMIEVKEENHFTDEHLMCTFDFLEIQLEASIYFFFPFSILYKKFTLTLLLYS